jgi:uracil-DNA glycosylase
MSERLPESLQKKISQRLSFYDDLGLRLFYKDRADARVSQLVSPALNTQNPEPVEIGIPSTVSSEDSSLPKSTPQFPIPQATPSTPVAPPKPSSTIWMAPPQKPASSFASASVPQKPSGTQAPKFVAPLPSPSGPSLFEAANKIEGDTLLKIRADLGDCTRCKLHKTRHNIVFADGNPNAELVFVGEGPGHDEDMQGLPFVGRAGKLLTQMIEAMGLQRKDVYICNVVKCRPPENRLPEKDEIAACSPFLIRQLDTINPKVIVCLGACSAQTLLQTNRGISHFRGEWLEFRGKKLMATYHPAYLLRNPPAKSEVWKDLQKVMAVLGLQGKKKSAEAGV